MSHTFGYNRVPDIRDPDMIFLNMVLSPSHGPQANVGSSLQNSQHCVYGARLGMGSISARFQIKWSRRFLNLTRRVTDNSSGKRQMTFLLDLLRKNVSVNRRALSPSKFLVFDFH